MIVFFLTENISCKGPLSEEASEHECDSSDDSSQISNKNEKKPAARRRSKHKKGDSESEAHSLPSNDSEEHDDPFDEDYVEGK